MTSVNEVKKSEAASDVAASVIRVKLR